MDANERDKERALEISNGMKNFHEYITNRQTDITKARGVMFEALGRALGKRIIVVQDAATGQPVERELDTGEIEGLTWMAIQQAKDAVPDAIAEGGHFLALLGYANRLLLEFLDNCDGDRNTDEDLVKAKRNIMRVFMEAYDGLMNAQITADVRTFKDFSVMIRASTGYFAKLVNKTMKQPLAQLEAEEEARLAPAPTQDEDYENVPPE